MIEPLQQAAIDAADASIAVLDGGGTIIGVNHRWVGFGLGNGRPKPEADIGRPYPTSGHARLKDVFSGVANTHSFVYPCHSPAEVRWYRLLAVRVARQDPVRILVVHRRIEEAPAESDIAPAALELTLRWLGIATVCAWCERQVRDPLGGWVAGRPEPGRRYSHGVCDRCVSALLPDGQNGGPAAEPPGYTNPS